MSDEKTEAEWREILTPEQYAILREKGTERAFTGALWDHKGKGVYSCAGCGTELFDSETKYDSGSGWPSFWAPVADGRIRLEDDSSFGMRRIPRVLSSSRRMRPSATGAQKLGQPEPESYLVSLSKSSVPQPAQL